jgi:5-methylcytosine-specific restriction endonuclease McrA
VLCRYCRRPLGLNLHFDHATPTARGGTHSLDNLAVCCLRWNALKGILTADEFAALLAFLARLHLAEAKDLARRLLAGGRRYRRPSRFCGERP